MITQSQLEELASFYQIDQFTVFREYLQLTFLNYLYQQPRAEKVYFKGGTAIHLLFGSPRFSEDLDFSTEYNQEEIKRLVKIVEKEITKELPDFKISPLYQGQRSIRFKVKYLQRDFKYPFAIRLDFTEKEKPLKKVLTSSLVTRFPLVLFPVVLHYSAEEILAEKIRAFLARAKGRDLFDLWFLLEKKVLLDNNLVRKKLHQAKKSLVKEELMEKIKNFPAKDLEHDLAPFLPRPQRKIIGDLKEKLLTQLLF